MNTRFTIEEENIVAIYAEDSRETTLENILAAMPYMDEDMRQLAAAAVNKLQAMTDSEFSAIYKGSPKVCGHTLCVGRLHPGNRL